MKKKTRNIYTNSGTKMVYVHMYMKQHTQNHKIIKETTVRTFKRTHRIGNTLSPTPETRSSSGDLVRPRNIGVFVTQSAQALNEMYFILIFSLNFVTLDGLLFQ